MARPADSIVQGAAEVSASATSDYSVLAAEYYDPIRHPTSANFRSASVEIVRGWLPCVLPSKGLILDVGAGDSVVAAVMAERRAPLERLLLTDSSEVMLAHSEPWIQMGARAEVADAANLPVRDQSVGVLVASLGDPYNTADFWTEARRVLHPRGLMIFTTPSHEWSESFRSLNGEPEDSAEFELTDGRKVRVPSFIYDQARQRHVIAQAKLSVAGLYSAFLGELGDMPISPKLAVDAGTPIVVGYKVTRC
jgi:SAM-dependent methyltransferase